MSRVAGADVGEKTESMLGRRLRPWWGQSPGRLVMRGVVGVAFFGAVVYVCLLLRAGEVDLTETGVQEHRDSIEQWALVVASVAALGVAYRLAQFVVGLADLFPRRSVEGVVVSARQRRAFDFLPRIVQHLLFRTDDYSRRSRHLTRRTRFELVLETHEGRRSWNLRSRKFPDLRAGTRVRLTASPLLGHVTEVVPLEGPPGASQRPRADTRL